MRVVIERLSKTYRDRTGQAVEALQSIDLSVEEEEFLAIVGPSGCGKSTLLNLIAGLLTPTEGGVFFEGLRGRRRGGQGGDPAPLRRSRGPGAGLRPP